MLDSASLRTRLFDPVEPQIPEHYTEIVHRRKPILVFTNTKTGTYTVFMFTCLIKLINHAKTQDGGHFQHGC